MTGIDKQTIQYYNDNAAAYCESVNAADMTETYKRFLKNISKGTSIADIGCGSGRDLKYFREAGYKADGVDASIELCKLARSYSGCPIICSDFLEWEPDIKFDAFWANASLLHLRQQQILEFFRTKIQYLKNNGIMYLSMKRGIQEGSDSKGRFFTPFSEELLEAIMEESKMKVIDRWTSSDSLNRTGFGWESIIIQKKGNL